MLWNWYTVDACFLSTQWHIRSHGVLPFPSVSFLCELIAIRSAGAFAGSVIAVFLTTALVEGVRRAAREYDRKLIAQAPLHSRNAESAPLAGPSAMKSMSFLNLPMWCVPMMSVVLSYIYLFDDVQLFEGAWQGPSDPFAAARPRGVLRCPIHRRVLAHATGDVLQRLHAHGTCSLLL